ncbi:MAG: sigma 54-interacting transcriptional regulator, partial [Bacillota bacterium]|nr:sigma 54-interacting transcriptional regulator [Bacillota bacterium]
RVLQNRTVERIGGITSVDVDVRILAATNKNLEEMVERKEFREDLYFRLNVIPLHILPLRERSEDILPLLMRALTKFNEIMQKQITGFTDDSIKILTEYHWPGNVRELENVVEYAVNMETTAMISPENLPARIVQKQSAPSFPNKSSRTLKEQTDDAQRQIIEDCLKTTGYHRDGKKEAASILGISESSLYRKMRELGLQNYHF